MERMIGLAIRHEVLANVLMVIIIAAGIVAGNSMLRADFPEIEPTTFSVTVIFPGADVEEVEEGISRKLEEVIDGLEGVERYHTISRENMGQAFIEIEDRYPMSKARDLIENAVDSISTFPVSAEKPVITDALFTRTVLELTLWGDMDEYTLKETAEAIKDELQSDPAITQVGISGLREYEIVIEISEDRLREYGLDFAAVTEAIRRGSVNLAGGSLRTEGEQISIRASGRKYTGSELNDIVVVASELGDVITLGQIATIRDGFTEDPVIARFNGHPAALITLARTRSEDMIAIAEAGHRYVKEKSKTLPEGVHLSSWADGSVVIDDRLSITAWNGFIGLCIVLLSLWVFLNTRLSFWVAMGIPISVSGSLVIMWMSSLTLNSVTLFGLVMVLGIVVDDAIVVGEAIFLRRSMGDGPLRAATQGVMEVGLPVTAAVFTTIVAFLPLGFISGTMGQFMATMAIAVIGALATSLIEALFILPAHLSHLPDPVAALKDGRGGAGRRIRQRIDRGLNYFIERIYGAAVRRAIRYRYVALCVSLFVVLFTAGLGGGGFIKFTPFPNWDDNQILAVVEFPVGTPGDITAAAVEQTVEGLHDYAATQEAEHGEGLVELIYSVVGQSGGGTGTHTGMIRAQLRHSNDRKLHSQDIIAGWERQVGDIAGTLSQKFSSLEGGPGGSPIEIWLFGQDTDTLRAVSLAIKDRLNTYEGVYQVQDSFRPGKRELKVDIRPEARALGITLDDLAQQIYAGFYGAEADRIQRGRDDVRIKVRYSEDQRSALANLGQVRIRTQHGAEVPFFTVADVEFGTSPSTVERADGQRRIAVTAEVDEKRTNAVEILGDMQANFFPGLEKQYAGFRWSYEGAQQDTRESSNSLMRLFPLALIGVFIIVATIFRSYVQPVVIIVTVPFGIIGAILGHVFMGWPIVMFSVFGMMALTGVVVNDAIILIEAVNTQIAKGVPVMEAIARGGMRRFRAILLTTLSTVGALIPIIIETDLSAQPLNPMALSVASGVLFATVLTLIFIPCLIGILNDFRRMVFWAIHMRWPTREEVEPARLRNAELFDD